MNNLYDFPKFSFGSKNKNPFKERLVFFIVSIIIISSFFGFLSGFVSSVYFLHHKDYIEKLALNIEQLFKKESQKTDGVGGYIAQTSQEQAIINAVKEFSPAVVSIVISKDVPIMEEYFYNPFEGISPFEVQIPQYRQKGTEKKEIGGGTGFIISQDGLVLTNKHVALDETAEYTVFTNDGKKFPAKILARDPIQDLAILKIEQEKSLNDKGEINSTPFPMVKLGDSDGLQIGQTVIAIGNALGEFRNTVSVGVISGLGRSITASGGSFSETLEDVIQADAAINKGNSGGPLLNLKGEVIGINTAMAEEAQSIGFAIPINKAKRDIEQIKKIGKIIYPFLGVRYVIVNEEVKNKYNLEVDYGVLILKGENGESAIASGSAAEKAGLKEKDIILEFNNEKITQDNSLSKIIIKYSPGDKITLKILRDKKEMSLEIVLGERSE